MPLIVDYWIRCDTCSIAGPCADSRDTAEHAARRAGFVSGGGEPERWFCRCCAPERVGAAHVGGRGGGEG